MSSSLDQSDEVERLNKIIEELESKVKRHHTIVNQWLDNEAGRGMELMRLQQSELSCREALALANTQLQAALETVAQYRKAFGDLPAEAPKTAES